MSTRVYGWDSNPIVDRFAYRCSNSSADNAVFDGLAFEIIDGEGRRAIQLAEPTPFEREMKNISANAGPTVSANAILLFIKTHCSGDKLHYEIPMAGDVGLRRHGLFRRTNEAGISELLSHQIRVSAKSGRRTLAAVLATPTFASSLLAG